jgi:orotidine-5'-phosphate decarboxylase
MMISPDERLIVALDVDNLEKAEKLVDALCPPVKIFKVGSQLFTTCGQEVIKMIRDKGAKVFLDLKFHDIPETVKRAVTSATNTNYAVEMLTVHTIGGSRMLQEAVQSAKFGTKVLGVTVLTSMDAGDLESVGINQPVEKEVVQLARLAKEAGLKGVVASAKEIPLIRKEIDSKDFIIVTPGIRPSGSQAGDQKRVVTPAEAIRKGADCIVVGRPIIEADDPRAVATRIIEEIAKNAHA